MNEFEFMVLGVAIYATLVVIAFDVYKSKKRGWGCNHSCNKDKK